MARRKPGQPQRTCLISIIIITLLTLVDCSAWHGYKYIDPAESGAVLPIVHVNGFKISERTIYGTMDDRELCALFSGYGYQVRFVEDLENIDQDLAASMEWALKEIRRIQKAAREGNPIVKPRWPVLIMRTPKVCTLLFCYYRSKPTPLLQGWGGPKIYKGEYIEGSFHSHQVPLPAASSDEEQLSLLRSWLESYKIHELIDIETGVPDAAIDNVVPSALDKRLGMRKEVYKAYQALDIVDWKTKGVEKGTQESCMKSVGELLYEVVKAYVLVRYEFSCHLIEYVLTKEPLNIPYLVARRTRVEQARRRPTRLAP